MAAIGIQEYLEEKIAESIAAYARLIPFKGIIRQVAPDYRPEIGTVLQGEAAFPFISISSVLPENFDVAASFTSFNAVVRPVTVVLIADKLIVERDGAIYKRYRELAMAAVHLNRFRGEIAPEPTSCVFQAIVKPKSQVEVSAWIGQQKWVSAFDVSIETREARVFP